MGLGDINTIFFMNSNNLLLQGDDSTRTKLISVLFILVALVMPAATDEVDDLILDLKYGTPDVRADAALSFYEIVDARAVDPLIAALNDETPSVRWIAAGALGRYTGNARAVDPLIEALKDEEPWVRHNAANSLGWLGDDRAVDPLIEALKDEDWRVRGMVARSLGKIGDMKAVDPLIAVYQEAYDSMNLYYDKYSTVPEDVYYAYLCSAGSLMNLGNPEYFESIASGMESPDSWIRHETVSILSETGDPRAVDPIIKALRDEDGQVRREAAMALGEIGNLRAVDPLAYMALRDEDEYVRVAAAEALEKIGAE